MGEAMLRVGNIRSEEDLELVRDVLDEIGAEYEHVDSEPEDSFPQTAYFQISYEVSGDADNLLARLSEEYGFDPEIL
jgi:coenzyme F420-reducing hydrogenase delta subunit